MFYNPRATCARKGGQETPSPAFLCIEHQLLVGNIDIDRGPRLQRRALGGVLFLTCNKIHVQGKGRSPHTDEKDEQSQSSFIIAVDPFPYFFPICLVTTTT